MASIKGLGLDKPRCPDCGVPLNKDGSHHASFATPCKKTTAQSSSTSGNTIGWESRTGGK